MRPRITEHDFQTINAFKQHKVLTIKELGSMLHLSIATIRRRLKEWGTLSSYNHSGRYYTLPSIPKFNKKGLWKYREIFFSKHGTLKNTIIHLVQISTSGLSNFELEEILGINPNSYLPQFKELAGVKGEKHNRLVVYFSSSEKVYQRQKQNRFPPESSVVKLPPDALTIVALVELVKNPNSTPVQLSEILKRNGHQIDVQIIENLFEHHGLKKN